LRNISYFLSIVCCGIAWATDARADFLLRPDPPNGSAVSIQAPAPQPDEPAPVTQSPLEPPHPRVLLARGFGRHVPLSFAARQIVPSSITVMYANNVDTSETVDWSGGTAWNVALTRAIQPLGLRIRVAPRAVTVYR
jgi:hypothetical protein